MLIHSPQDPSACLRDDIDPKVLENTKAYLECRLRRCSPRRQLAEAWHQFYQLCDPLIRRFASACGAPAVELNDCVQDIWATLITNLRDFRYDPQRSRFVSWLYTLVHNKVTDLIRLRSRHRTESLTRSAEALLCDLGRDPATACAQRALMHDVLEKLRAEVSERNYCVLYMRSVEGCPIAEVAAALDLTPDQVRFRHHRMKRKLRRLADGNPRAAPPTDE